MIDKIIILYDTMKQDGPFDINYSLSFMHFSIYLNLHKS